MGENSRCRSHVDHARERRPRSILVVQDIFLTERATRVWCALPPRGSKKSTVITDRMVESGASDRPAWRRAADF